MIRLAGVLCLLLVACSPTVPAAAVSRSPAIASSSPVSACHAHDGLPDSQCTPGAVDPRITQANVSTTICVAGYSATVRPPTSYTEPLKLRQMALYGYAGQSPADFEFDHLVSLEDGGSPTDPANLWPEAYAGPHGARVKDRVEGALKARICGGTLSLADAQQAEMTNWIEAYRLYVGPLP